MSGIEQMLELMSRPSTPAPEGVYMVRPLAEASLEALEAKAPLSAEVRDLRAVLAEPREQLWAIHSVGPGEEFPCLNKDDAERRAQELRDIGQRLKQERIAKGESIEHWPDWIVNVIPSPWEPAEHFEIMAQEWTDDADQLRKKVTAIIAENGQLKAQNEALLKQVAALQSDANSWQTGYDEGRRMGTKTALSERDSFRRLAGFWRSPKDLPPEGAPLVVLRDAGAVGNPDHPGQRAGRWLELSAGSGGRFACDFISTGNVMGWVTLDEFKGLRALIQNTERYQVLRQADIDTIRNGGLFAGLTPENIVINGQDLDERTDAVISARMVQGH